MAIAVDASTPAVATQTSATTATCTSASFTPPAGAVIFVLYAGNAAASETTTAPTITDNRGAPLTYTLINHRNRGDTLPVSGSSGQAAMWRAVVTTSAAMTITTTTSAASGNRQQAFLPLVLTGVDTTTPVGTVGENSIATGSLSQAVTGTAAGSLAIVAWSDWQVGSTTFTAGTGCTVAGSSTMGGNCNFAAVRRTTPDGTNGGSTTVSLSSPSSNNQNWVWAEVLAGAAAVALPPRIRAVTAQAINRTHYW